MHFHLDGTPPDRVGGKSQMKHQYDRRDIFLTLTEASSLFPLLSLTPKNVGCFGSLGNGTGWKGDRNGTPRAFQDLETCFKIGASNRFLGTLPF